MKVSDSDTGSGSRDSQFASLPGDISVSFEFYPPASETGEEQLFRAFHRLQPFAPSFVQPRLVKPSNAVAAETPKG